VSQPENGPSRPTDRVTEVSRGASTGAHPASVKDSIPPLWFTPLVGNARNTSPPAEKLWAWGLRLTMQLAADGGVRRVVQECVGWVTASGKPVTRIGHLSHDSRHHVHSGADGPCQELLVASSGCVVLGGFLLFFVATTSSAFPADPENCWVSGARVSRACLRVIYVYFQSNPTVPYTKFMRIYCSRYSSLYGNFCVS